LRAWKQKAGGDRGVVVSLHDDALPVEPRRVTLN
jgi:hypothetical protein